MINRFACISGSMMSKVSTLTLAVAFALAGTAYAQTGPATLAPAPAPAPIAPVTGAPATFANVVLATIKQGALDMSSDAAIDDFAKVEYCDIYKKYHGSEFDWRRVRTALRKKIELDKPSYPTRFISNAARRSGNTISPPACCC